MRLRPLVLVATAVALPLAGCHTARGSAPAPTGAVADAASWDAPTRLLVDSAGARLAVLELRRVALRTLYSDRAPAMRAVHRQITALEHQLAAVPASETARARALSAVLTAFAQRDAGLQIARARSC